MSYTNVMNRTTVRIKPEILKKTKKLAMEKDLSLQDIVNISLQNLIIEMNKEPLNKPKNIKNKIPTIKLGKNIDQVILDREFIYGTPKV